jgi:hypothetical protein
MNVVKDLTTAISIVATLENQAAKQKETSKDQKYKKKLKSLSTKLLCQGVTRDIVLDLFLQVGLKETDLTLKKLSSPKGSQKS